MAEYLHMLEDRRHLPVGCVSLQVTRNSSTVSETRRCENGRDFDLISKSTLLKLNCLKLYSEWSDLQYITNLTLKTGGGLKQVYFLIAAHIVERSGGECDLGRHRESGRRGNLQRQVLHGERAGRAPRTGGQLLQYGQYPGWVGGWVGTQALQHDYR